jgi:hypothetical protein
MSTPPLKVLANRANALKSTGPRTSSGKAASSRNALKHGVLSWQPVLLPGESPDTWRQFARAIVLQLGPQGPVEAMYAGRIALLLWRLQRVARHQSALADHLQRGVNHSAPKSPHWKQRIADDPTFPTDLQSGRKRLAQIRRDLAALQKFIATPDDQRQSSPIDADIAVSLITLAAQQHRIHQRISEMLMAGSYPGLGQMSPDRAQLPTLYRWNAAMLAAAFGTLASWTPYKPHHFIAGLESGLRQVGPLRRLKPLASAQRYEAGIERSLTLTLHQLMLLQAARPDLPADPHASPPDPQLNTTPTPTPDPTQTP